MYFIPSLNDTWTHGEIRSNIEELPRHVVESGSKLLSHLYTAPQFLSLFPYSLEFLPYRKASCSFMGNVKQTRKRLTCKGKETHKPRLNWDFSATDVIAQYPIPPAQSSLQMTTAHMCVCYVSLSVCVCIDICIYVCMCAYVCLCMCMYSHILYT